MTQTQQEKAMMANIRIALFRNPKPEKWSVIIIGGGKKDSPHHEEFKKKPVKSISREDALILKNKFNFVELRDQFGSHGFKGEIPKKVFDAI